MSEIIRLIIDDVGLINKDKLREATRKIMSIIIMGIFRP